jgi:hypothetical protein
MWNVRQLRTSSKCWLESLKIRIHSEDKLVHGKTRRRWVLKEQEMRAWIGFMWLNTGTNGRLLLSRYRHLKFHNWWRT